MKVHIVQPPYSKDYSKSQEIFEWEMKAFDDCPKDADSILFPESCDVPCSYPSKDAYFESVNKYCDKLMNKASETAIRCNSNVIINLNAETDGKRRNTTCVFDRKGELVFKYFKQHLKDNPPNKICKKNTFFLRCSIRFRQDRFSPGSSYATISRFYDIAFNGIGFFKMAWRNYQFYIIRQ